MAFTQVFKSNASGAVKGVQDLNKAINQTEKEFKQTTKQANLLRGHLGIYVICASRFSFSYWRVGGLVSLRSMRLLIAIWISAVLLSIVASYSLLNRR